MRDKRSPRPRRNRPVGLFWRGPWRKAAIAAALLFPALAVLGPTAFLYAATAGRRTAHPDRAGTAPVAMVFGAGLAPDGGLSPLLRDRVDVAVGLYDRGQAGALLMTGDHSTTTHDEVGAMTDYAVARGVPRVAIAQDHAGFTTYDSCFRARAVFGVDRAILVTTRFHVPRAVYTCRRLGVRAVGVGAPDFGRYRNDAPGWQLREVLAGAKALWQVHVTRPRPHFLGPREPFPGTVVASDP